jgi:hypothetical protein
MRVTERFTRTAPDMLLYQFTVNAPDMYTAPWSGEIPMRSFPGPVYSMGAMRETTGWTHSLGCPSRGKKGRGFRKVST